MSTIVRKTAPFGELVVAAFDKAALSSTDPREVSRLATRSVMRTLRRVRRASRTPRRWPLPEGGIS